MAEFVQTMNDWKRMCLSYKSCSDCPMMDEDGCAHVLCSEGGIQSAVPEIQEAVIEKWAAEHPEPVYPTWIEWLKSMGIIPYLDGRVVKHDYDDNYLNGHVNVNEIIFKPIPKDVAEKLGIEPKEE